MSRLARLAALLLFAAAGTLSAQDSADTRAEEFRDKLRALNWVVGPRELTMSGNATLSLPEGYVYLDAATVPPGTSRKTKFTRASRRPHRFRRFQVDGFELHQLAGERNHLGLLDALSRRLRGRARPNANARTAAGIRGRNGLKQFAGIVEHGI